MPLTALPKNDWAEHDPMDREAQLENLPKGKELSKKETARLKSRKAVVSAQARDQVSDSMDGDEEDERSTKRAKSEHDPGAEKDAMEGIS